jgi:hypothetical protein
MRDVLAFAVDCCWWWWSCCASVVADVLRIRATEEGKKTYIFKLPINRPWRPLFYYMEFNYIVGRTFANSFQARLICNYLVWNGFQHYSNICSHFSNILLLGAGMRSAPSEQKSYNVMLLEQT